MLVRFIAVALIGWALAELALYLVICEQKHLTIQVFPCLFKVLPLLAGLVMLVKAKALAEWIANLLDD